jgi:multiple sugar transport system permease protein
MSKPDIYIEGQAKNPPKSTRNLLRGMKTQRTLSIFMAYCILIFASLFIILPLVWIFLTSIKAPNLAYQIPPQWFFTPTLENYKAIFIDLPFPRYFLNSAIIASTTTLLAIAFGSFAAYSISRFRTGGDFFTGWIFNNRTMPAIAILIPIFLLSNAFGLFDTYPSLIIPYLSFLMPFAIWMMIGFFDSVPREMEEAALVDGATRLEALRFVTMPIAAPGIAATGLLCFLFSWNEFLLALILTGNNSRTLPVAVANFLTNFGVYIGGLSAATMVMIIPVMLLAFFIRGYLVRGLSLGAVK